MKESNTLVFVGLIIALTYLACSPKVADRQSKDESSVQFDWLIGDWQRSNDEAGKTTFEQWQKLSTTEYHGLGFTMEAADTVFKETIVLIAREDKWYFEVSGVNEEPTIFTLTQYDSQSFQCENPANEFPKVIHYTFEAPLLKAVISAGEIEVPFDFEPVKD